MSQKTSSAPLMPGTFGAYAPAVKAGSYVFISGQLGVDPATGTLAPGGVEAETRQCLANMRMILFQLGLTMSDVAKTTVFLRNIADIDLMNAVYAEAFGDHRPARSTVQIVALNKGALVEIEAVAYLGAEE
ncbi:MAG: Rid family detoxifying hydrolase [Spirochaetia bacterium]|nr:Rid family detoxifying hydrolase [Spirochaetales bacterium]MDX9784365.1 Rid family detoxifying hydrolase [Spirochaetia bacterium]